MTSDNLRIKLNSAYHLLRLQIRWNFHLLAGLSTAMVQSCIILPVTLLYQELLTVAEYEIQKYLNQTNAGHFGASLCELCMLVLAACSSDKRLVMGDQL